SKAKSGSSDPDASTAAASCAHSIRFATSDALNRANLKELRCFSVTSNMRIRGRSLLSSGFSGFGAALVAPGNQEHQTDPGANRAIGDVKSGESFFQTAAWLDVKINEINYVTCPNPVNQ